MDEAKFRQDRIAEGYKEFNVIEWEPGRVNTMHRHDFAAHVLVLAGEIAIAAEDGGTKTYRPGETFVFARDVPHEETIGPQGVKILSVRKYG